MKNEKRKSFRFFTEINSVLNQSFVPEELTRIPRNLSWVHRPFFNEKFFGSFEEKENKTNDRFERAPAEHLDASKTKEVLLLVESASIATNEDEFLVEVPTVFPTNWEIRARLRTCRSFSKTSKIDRKLKFSFLEQKSISFYIKANQTVSCSDDERIFSMAIKIRRNTDDDLTQSSKP